MNRRRTRLASWAAALVFSCASFATAGAQRSVTTNNPNKVTILIPSFVGEPAPLGESVGTILMLHFWKTMRGVAPCPPPGGAAQGRSSNRPCSGLRFFEEGSFRWQKKPLDQATHEAAETAAALPPYRAQLVLWGRTYRYGDDVVVLSYLTLPDLRDNRTRRLERWSLTVPTPKKPYTIDTDIPTRKFAFEPIVLTSAFVSDYSLPTRLKVYRTPTGQGFVGYAVPPILSKLAQQGNALQTAQGWILVPELSSAPSETVDFVGAMMRVFRGDWDGALELLAPVARNPRTPTELRIDSMLLMGLANYHLGGDFQSPLRAAEDLNPLASRVVRYRVMGMLAELQAADQQSRAPLAAAAKKYLDGRAHLFAADDRWLLAVNDALSSIAEP